MSHDTTHKLVKMANQIGDFFSAQREEEALPGAVEHLRKFWTPHMRAAITNYVNGGGDDLNPMALAAVKALAGK